MVQIGNQTQKRLIGLSQHLVFCSGIVVDSGQTMWNVASNTPKRYNKNLCEIFRYGFRVKRIITWRNYKHDRHSFMNDKATFLLRKAVMNESNLNLMNNN